MKHRKKDKILSMGFIIIGLLLLVYPKASDLYQTYQQQKLSKLWKQSFKMVDQYSSNNIDYDNHNEKTEFNKIDESNYGSKEDITIYSYVDKTNYSEKKAVKNSHEKNGENLLEKVNGDIPIEGIINIEIIDLELPILTDASDKNLKLSVASIKGTGKPGQIGNYSIAGHRSHTYGKNFNRLNEVRIGDIIKIDNGNEQYEYEVIEKIYVKPDEVWVLEGNNIDKEITLVTCHPMINPTHRLIVKGKIME